MRFVNYHEVTDGQSVNTQLGHQSAEQRVPRREREDERAAQLHSKVRRGNTSTARAHKKRRKRKRHRVRSSRWARQNYGIADAIKETWNSDTETGDRRARKLIHSCAGLHGFGINAWILGGNGWDLNLGGNRHRWWRKKI